MIRSITKKDRELYRNMVREFYHSPAVLHPIPDTYIEKTFDEILRRNGYLAGYILEAQTGVGAGYALVAKTFSQEAGGVTWWLDELFILPEYRSHGLGREFFQHLEEQAKQEGVCRIRLEVEEENQRAVQLYQKIGFQPFSYRQMIKEQAAIKNHG